jgi:RecA-family ATPase
MLSGGGGVGKSLLAAQLAVAFASDGRWIGIQSECGPVLFVSAEDDRDELHRRFAAIAESDGLDLANLRDLHIVPLAGRDAVMGATESRNSVVKETAVWRGLVRLVERIKPHLVILDTLADIFGGNEIVRTEARQFIGQLRGLAIEHGLAVLLLSHPSLGGINSGTGTSGSTAWSNSVRSRLYLETVKGEDGNEVDPDLRVLTTKKANYSARGGEIELRWSNGRFVRGGEQARFTFREPPEASGAPGYQEFMTKIRDYLASGRRLSSNERSGDYAPKVLAKKGKGRAEEIKANERAMERAFRANAIRSEIYGSPSRGQRAIVLC